MPNQDTSEFQHADTIHAVLPKLKVLGFIDFKSELPEHPDPRPLPNSVGSDQHFVPDMVANRKGRMAFIEIAKKTTNEQRLVLKWTMLAQIAAIKNSFFAIVTPKGTVKLTQRLLESHGIVAKTIRI